MSVYRILSVQGQERWGNMLRADSVGTGWQGVLVAVCECLTLCAGCGLWYAAQRWGVPSALGAVH